MTERDYKTIKEIHEEMETLESMLKGDNMLASINVYKDFRGESPNYVSYKVTEEFSKGFFKYAAERYAELKAKFASL